MYTQKEIDDSLTIEFLRARIAEKIDALRDILNNRDRYSTVDEILSALLEGLKGLNRLIRALMVAQGERDEAKRRREVDEWLEDYDKRLQGHGPRNAWDFVVTHQRRPEWE